MTSGIRFTGQAVTALLLFVGSVGASYAQQTLPPIPDCTAQLPAAIETKFSYYDYPKPNKPPGHREHTFWVRPKVCYGNGDTWYEPVTDAPSILLTERAAFWTPTDPALDGPDTKPRPLIIWTHPNGQTEDFRYVKDGYYTNNDNVLLASVLAPAMQAGYALASLEFRHPAASYIANVENPLPGNTDIRDAIQYIRANAAALHIDPENIFLVGQSRGSLNMFWGIRNDDAQPGQPTPAWRSQSTKVRAIWDYQAQTCYQKERVKGVFITAADQVKFETDPDNPDLRVGYDPGCSMDEVATALPQSIPPFRIMYDEMPKSTTAVTKQGWCLLASTPAECADEFNGWQSYFDIHDANFGVAMWSAYKKAGQTSMIKTCFGVSTAFGNPSGPYNGYKDYTLFFDAHKTVPVVGATPPDCPVVVQNP